MAETSDARAPRSRSEFESHELLQALPMPVYTTDAAGRITFYNEAAAALWGCRPELGKSEICGSWRLYWPDGRPMQHDECPMAMALKEQRAISGAEAAAERPDGVRVPFLAYPRPLFDEAGRLAGAVNMLVDIMDRKKAENAALRLAAIVESSDDAIVSKDLDGIIATWNPGAERLFGYTAGEAIGKPVTMLIPPDHLDEEPEILQRIRRGERVEHYETIRRRKDGSLVDISLTVSPIKNSDGRVIGASKIACDISDRRQHQEQQRLLFREMNHRIRNLFTLAGTIVSLSTRFAATPEELADVVNARLVALGRAHDLTLPDIAGGAKNFDQATTLPDLAHTILAPYGSGSLSIHGPDVPVSGKPAMSIALLLHELATNAAKYGALTSESGCVELSWRVSDDELVLTWRERGGPPVAGRPETEGFGSLLARRTATSQLSGKIFHDWNEKGLIVTLSAPLARLTEQEQGG